VQKKDVYIGVRKKPATSKTAQCYECEAGRSIFIRGDNFAPKS